MPTGFMIGSLGVRSASGAGGVALDWRPRAAGRCVSASASAASGAGASPAGEASAAVSGAAVLSNGDIVLLADCDALTHNTHPALSAAERPAPVPAVV